MSGRSLQKGFSLSEVLLAAGILAIGFMLIAAIFPVGVRLTTISAERTISSIVLKEARSKLNLFQANPAFFPASGFRYFNRDALTTQARVLLYDKFRDLGVADDIVILNGRVDNYLYEQSLYPSLDEGVEEAKYNWQAVCRYVDDDSIRAVIFVNRKAGDVSRFPQPETDPSEPDYGYAVPVTGPVISLRPMPVKVDLIRRGDLLYEMEIDTAADWYIVEGSKLLRNSNGAIINVTEKEGAEVTIDYLIHTDDIAINDTANPLVAWVVPPAYGSGRDPCVGVYPRQINYQTATGEGAIGDLTFVLTWSYSGSSNFEGPDLNIRVIDPDGNTLTSDVTLPDLSPIDNFYVLGPTLEGGIVDKYDEGGWGSGDGAGPERIYWPIGSAPTGTYSCFVSNDHGDGTANYIVRVYRNGMPNTIPVFMGTLAPGEFEDIGVPINY